MCKYAILLLLVTTGAVLPARAEEKLDTLARMEEKLRQHPEIAAYASRVEASGSYADGELGLPDPMLFIEQEDYRFSSPSMGRGGGDTMLGLRQEIPRLGLREARADRMRIESRKNKLLQDYAFATMKAKMITAFANLQKIRELRNISLAQKKLLETQKQSLKGSVAANRASISSVQMTDADLQEINIMLAELEEERHEMEAMLVSMLGEAPDISLPPTEIAAWNNDPEKTYPVIIAASDINMAKKDVDIREAEYGPNFEIQASGGRMDGGDRSGTIMLGMSIPLWAAENQSPKLRGAKASLSSAELDRDAIKRQMIEKLEHLKIQIDTSAKKIKLFEKKESLLKAASDAASREYEAGKADFAMIMKSRREAFSARAQVATQRAKHAALVADFNRYLIQGEGL